MSPKAYSYLRFSTPEQLKGDSLRRQSELAVSYAKENRLSLDDSLTYVDKGVSAYHGLNAQIGALKQFLEHVETGLIKKGSYLLVESLDRISRDEILSALTVFLDIIQGGITIVTLLDNRKYNEKIVNANPTELLISILIMMRAREESATKSKRVKAVWENKRNNIHNEVLTRRCPSWIEYNDEHRRFEIIEEKAQIIKKIFRLALKGKGAGKIARVLNEQKTPLWGKAKYWSFQKVNRLIRDPAVTGTINLSTIYYVNGKTRYKFLMRVEGYYPKVITDKTFKRVDAVRHKTDYKAAPHEVRNILGFILRCPLCGSSMSMLQKKIYKLVCSRALNHSGCRINYVRYDKLEQAIINNIDEFNIFNKDKNFNPKISKLLQALRTEPLDKRIINLLLRQLFMKVVVDYTTGNLIFEWTHGGTTSIRYSDVNCA
jgi:DNA invertase Pin-like site-specific DNA recombinase